jgi:topoisomerase-4 subunit B
MLKNYCYLNTGLTFFIQRRKNFSENGLKDLLEEIRRRDMVYPSFTLRRDIE